MANVATIEDDNNLHYTTADRLESLNIRTEVNFDEYLILIIGIDHDDDLFKDFPRFLSKDLVQEFKDIEAIVSLENTNIFLIISDKLNKNQVDKFVSKHRIIGFYVYCKSKDKHTEWTKRNKTMERIVSNSTELLRQLHRDINVLTHQWSFNEKSFQKALTNTSRWYHLFLTIICYRSKYSAKYHKEMFDECRSYYSDNNRMIEEINILQKNYDECNLIYEYTRDHFLYRIINRALRTQNMETIKKFGPFINDLNSQLVKYNRKYLTSNEFPIRSVYRGQYLSLDQFKFLHSVWKSNNPIITLTTFGSTSLDPQVATDFSGFYSDDLIPCLFEIVFTDEYNEKRKILQVVHPYDLFGNISCDSAMKDEQEILFSPGIHFCIRSIEDPIYHSDRQWTPILLEIVLEADDKSYYNYLKIVEQIKQETEAQIYDDILDMLQINAENEIKFQQTNWDKWWNTLKRQWGKHYLNDGYQPLHLTFYNCFSNDLYWSRKAIEIYKIKLQGVPNIQSNRSSFSYLFQMYNAAWHELPTIWLALYEDYLELFCQRTDTEEVVKCLCIAGEHYKRIADYQRALECYGRALQINEENKYNTGKQITKQIEIIKKDMQPKSIIRHSKTEISIIEQIEVQDQRFVNRIIEQWIPDKSPILDVLLRLFKYMEKRERSYDLFSTKIILSFPFEVTTDLSNNDYYLNFFLALQRHLLNTSTSSANNYILSLWRYEKCYFEWIIFQSLEIFLRPLERKLNYLRTNFLPRLKR